MKKCDVNSYNIGTILFGRKKIIYKLKRYPTLKATGIHGQRECRKKKGKERRLAVLKQALYIRVVGEGAEEQRKKQRNQKDTNKAQRKRKGLAKAKDKKGHHLLTHSPPTKACGRKNLPK